MEIPCILKRSPYNISSTNKNYDTHIRLAINNDIDVNNKSLNDGRI
jgi:hypothetical protein